MTNCAWQCLSVTWRAFDLVATIFWFTGGLVRKQMRLLWPYLDVQNTTLNGIHSPADIYIYIWCINKKWRQQPVDLFEHLFELWKKKRYTDIFIHIFIYTYAWGHKWFKPNMCSSRSKWIIFIMRLYCCTLGFSHSKWAWAFHFIMHYLIFIKYSLNIKLSDYLHTTASCSYTNCIRGIP